MFQHVFNIVLVRETNDGADLTEWGFGSIGEVTEKVKIGKMRRRIEGSLSMGFGDEDAEEVAKVFGGIRQMYNRTSVVDVLGAWAGRREHIAEHRRLRA